MRSIVAALVTLALAAPTGALPTGAELELVPLGSYASGIFGEGGAEIVSFNPWTQLGLVVNALDISAHALDLRDPANPAHITTIDVSALGGSANSVAVGRRILAVAVEANVKTEPGLVAFHSTRDYRLLDAAPEGALPDMLTFTTDGERVLVANEGEPKGYGTPQAVDPEGSVSIINIHWGCDQRASAPHASAASTRGRTSWSPPARAFSARTRASPRIPSPNTSRPPATRPTSRSRRTTRPPSWTSSARG